MVLETATSAPALVHVCLTGPALLVTHCYVLLSVHFASHAHQKAASDAPTATTLLATLESAVLAMTSTLVAAAAPRRPSAQTVPIPCSLQFEEVAIVFLILNCLSRRMKESFLLQFHLALRVLKHLLMLRISSSLTHHLAARYTTILLNAHKE